MVIFCFLVSPRWHNGKRPAAICEEKPTKNGQRRSLPTTPSPFCQVRGSFVRV